MTDEELATVDAWLNELEPGCDGWYIDVALVRALRDEVERLREIVRAVAEAHSIAIGSQAALVSRKHNLESLRQQARAVLGLTD